MRRRRALRLGCAAFAAALLTAAAYFPLLSHPNSTALLAPGDMTSSARDYWAAAYQHETPFTLVHDRMMDVPRGRPAAPAVQIANALQPLFVMPVHRLTGYLGAFNLFMLLGVAASLVAMFALLDSMGLHPLAASAGAVAFGSCQWSAEQLLYGHVAFAQLWVFPLLLGSLLWARAGRPLRAVAPGLAYALSFYAFSYLGLLCSLVVVAYLLALVWSRRSLRVDLPRLGIGVGVALVTLLPVVLAPAIAPSSRIGLQRTSKDELFGAALRDFVLPSSRHPVYGRAVGELVGPHVGENVLFFGYATMGLACVAAAMLLAHRLSLSLPLRFALLAVPLGVLAALPAHESIAGVRVPMPDPAGLVGGVVSWWRVYERFGAVAGFGLVLLASVALDRLVRSGTRAHVAAACAVVALMVVEALPGLPVPTFRIGGDEVTAWLRVHPGGAVATYPIVPDRYGDPAWENLHWSSYYLQVYHRHPVFNAPRGAPPPNAAAVAAVLVDDLANADTPPILRGEGVRWVVLRPDVYRAMGDPVPRLAPGLQVAARFLHSEVLRVTAPAANLPALVAGRAGELAHRIAIGNAVLEFGDGFDPAEQYKGYPDARWLRQDGKLVVHPGSEPLPYVVYELRIRAFSAKVPHVVTLFEGSRRVGSFAVPTAEVDVVKTLRFPGIYATLTFHVEPGPTFLSATDRRVASVYFESVAVAPVGLALPG